MQGWNPGFAAVTQGADAVAPRGLLQDKRRKHKPGEPIAWVLAHITGIG